MLRQSSPLFFALLLLFPFPAIAQIIPDNSLGTESSRTVPDTINNLPSDRIEGGATRGVNLFHSLREFNIPEGRGAYFANPNGIANIFTRVTGGNPSNILGTLGVLGNSNLFLINPKGIVFGPNARLDLRGSFIGSTGSGVLFDNGFEFSAANSNAVPLLAINIPVGLRFRENPGTIINSSQAIGSTPALPPLPVEIPVSNKLGLAVDPGQTLALIGGDIQLQGGNLTAYTGQILLGSVKSPGLVQFEPTAFGVNLNYGNIQNFGNIEINGALINTTGLGGGKIDIRGGNVAVNGGRIFGLTLGNIDGRGIDINSQNLRVQGGAQIFTQTLGTGTGGAVNISATDSVELSGIGFDSFNRFVLQFARVGSVNPFDLQIILSSGTGGNGAAGDITIDTGRLLIENGSVISSSTLGSANGGNMTIRARVFDLVGSAINSGPIKGSTGSGGNITFEGEKLIVRDGSALISQTRNDKASGNINIQASESVEILRTPNGSIQPTFIGTTTIGQQGKAGDINIDTKRLIISDGGGISAGTGAIVANPLFGANGGPGGNITIRATDSIEIAGISGVSAVGYQIGSFLNAETASFSRGGDIHISTRVLTLGKGGSISTSSLGTGDAGNITIDAARIEVLGNNSSLFNSQILASVGFTPSFTNSKATANAGSVNLNTDQLILRNGSTVGVRSFGSGRAGNINVVANSIDLDNKASIDGTTVSGTGANINIQGRDIKLRRASRITTDAGSSDGGNINIKSDILVTLPNENSDITANARTARGGQVAVNVPNIFGFTAVNRDRAISSLGLTDAEFFSLQVNPTSLIPTSDIAAISQQAGPALQGAVTFSNSGVNPAQGLVELPQNVVNSTTLIAPNPCTQRAESEFTITGKGGVPVNPNDVLSSDSSQLNWVESGAGRSSTAETLPDLTDRLPSGGIGNAFLPESSPTGIIPAQGWVIDEQGQVRLVAYNSGGGTSIRSPKPTGVCVPQ
ncbi:MULTISPECIES: two-partner secretion domain-containing protein [unclassified Microcoleus]|uniref:two-partner secretion domain-containing protein n=1 Tax=unclassified Microcoleus TaxID=2642155 RepID=UPI002FD73E95